MYTQSLIILLLVFVNATLTLAATNSNKPVDFNVVTDCENITPDGTTDITQAFQTCINDKNPICNPIKSVEST